MSKSTTTGRSTPKSPSAKSQPKTHWKGSSFDYEAGEEQAIKSWAKRRQASKQRQPEAQPPSKTIDKLVDADLEADGDLLFSRYLQIRR